MSWILMIAAFGLALSPPLVALFGRWCFLGQHDWTGQLDKNVGKFMPYRYIFKCNRCGKVEGK